jgi:2-aminoadipate transaminase
MKNAQTMPATARLARRARAFEHSPWSAAEGLGDRHPDPIYFGNGAPGVEAQPIERLQWAAARAWAEAGGQLDYGELAGWPPLREYVCQRMTLRGIAAGPDDVLITNGSQQGIDLIARLMLDPGDRIIVEGPTYIGAMQTFDAYEASYLTCSVDEHGLCVDALEQILRESTPTPKLLYTIPTFQNPTGFSMTSERREAIVALCERYGVLIIEDDPYGEIYFGSEPPAPALRSLSERVIYLGTFSKTMAPGIRVGWMAPPPDLLGLLLMAREGADIHGHRIVTRTVYHAAQDFLDEHVERIRAHYRQRRDVLVDVLRAGMPDGVSVSEPGGGFFVWCELPEPWSTDDLLRHAATFGVLFLPGSWFYPDYAGPPRGLRLSYSSLPLDRIAEGGKRLAEATRDFMESRRPPR